jgi:AraC-like DNA-binding protein
MPMRKRAAGARGSRVKMAASLSSSLAARDDRRMKVPHEARDFTTGAQVGPLAAFRTTYTISGEHLESSHFVLFMPSPRLDFMIICDGKSIDMRNEDSSSIICKMPGMPSQGDKTGRCQPVLMAGVDADYLSSLAVELFDVGRLEIPFRRSRLGEDLRLDVMRFISALPADDAERAMVAECLIPLISLGFLRSCLPGLDSAAAYRHRHPGVERARALIEREYRSPIALTDLSAAAGLGKSQLIAAFKRQLGSTPHDYLCRVRIEEAKRLLARGRGVTDAAFDVGFSSLSGFEEAFRRLAGIAPVEYRRQAGG